MYPSHQCAASVAFNKAGYTWPHLSPWWALATSMYDVANHHRPLPKHFLWCALIYLQFKFIDVLWLYIKKLHVTVTSHHFSASKGIMHRIYLSQIYLLINIYICGIWSPTSAHQLNGLNLVWYWWLGGTFYKGFHMHVDQRVQNDSWEKTCETESWKHVFHCSLLFFKSFWKSDK